MHDQRRDLRVVAVLGRGVVPAETPILRADDLGVLRGDGIFETMYVRAGEAWLLGEHLTRMRRSAQLLQLNLPPAADLAELVTEAVAQWPADLEGGLRLVCTRGPEDAGGVATVFVTVTPVSEAHRRARHDGISARTANLGITMAHRTGAPWLLGGAKTLSYAVNMASQRWAAELGADDVLWVSSDGYALEGPTSTLVWLIGSTLHTVPVEGTGILAGTTASWLFAHVGELGWDVSESLITPDELLGVDGAWFTSSVRGAAPLRALDGRPMPFSDLASARLRDLLGFP